MNDRPDSDGQRTTPWEHGGFADIGEAPGPTPIEPGTEVDHFKVVRLIGRGGMGEVYLARDTQLGRKVALKVVHPRQIGSPDAARRFLMEARATARFSHPNIITIYGVGEHNGQPYVALEYLEGETLRERFTDQVASVRETARLGLAIAEALAEAHGHGVLHRDLKADNVLIPRDGRPRVLDFGLARMIQEKAAAPALAGGAETLEAGRLLEALQSDGQKLCGTPAYMAPEQWTGGELTGAADVWALGIVLHELVIGRRPLQDMETVIATLAWKLAEPDPIATDPALAASSPELAALIDRCLAKDPAERPSAAEAVEALAALVTPGRVRFDHEQSPFRGLQAFGERHADVFFGRDGEVAAFLERLREEPVLPVVGPSGAGKSSFVQAGIVPRLREQGPWLVLSMRPGDDPFLSMASRLLHGETSVHTRSTTSSRGGATPTLQKLDAGPQDVSADGETVTWEEAAPSVVSAPPSSPGEATGLAAEFLESPSLLGLKLQQLAEVEQRQVLLVVDQVEELFSLVESERVRERFMRAICTAADDPEGPVRVIFTMRDDFLGRLALSPQVREVLGRVTVIRTPGPEALAEILTRPLEVVGYRFDDPGLVDEMVADVRGEPASLPLLQFAVQTLWDRRDKNERTLRRSTYESLGGVAGALAEHAEGVLQGMTPAQVRATREILLRLVTPEGTRRVLPTERVLEGLEVGSEDVLARLTQSRLISVRKSRRGGAHKGGELELVHESLIRCWKQLSQWIDESREELVFLAEIGQAAELWERRGRRKEEVWAGDALAEARRILARTTTRVPREIEVFLEACEEREQRRAQRKRLLTLSGFGVLALVALVSMLVSLALAEREREARRQQEIALSRQADAQREGARAAMGRGDLLEARAKLRSSLEIEDSPLARSLWWSLQRQQLVLRATLGAVINDVTFSPDGHTVAVACGDRSIHLYDIRSMALRVLRGHEDQVYAVAFSPDGALLASGDWDGEMRLWDLANGSSERLAGHKGAVNFLAFDPDGHRLASGGGDGTVRIWDLAGGQAPVVLESHQGGTNGVAFSPDGKLLASGGRDRKIRLLDLETRDVRVMTGHTAAVTNLAFSPDSRLLASGGIDRSVRIWDAAAAKQVEVLEGHVSKVWDVAFNPADGTLASCGWDGTIHLWKPGTGEKPRIIEGNDSGTYTFSISPTGRLLASGSTDMVLQIWDLGIEQVNRAPSGHDSQVMGVAVAPDGKRLVSAGLDNTLRLWDTRSGAQLEVVSGLAFDGADLEFSPDGRYVAFGSYSASSIGLWDLEGPVTAIPAHPSSVLHLEFSPNGQWLTSTGGDGKAWVWDTARWEPVHKLATGESSAVTAAFSPDNSKLAVSSVDGLVWVWDLRDGRLIAKLTGHAANARGVVFASESQLISSSEDGSLRIWDYRQGTNRIISRIEGRLYDIEMHPSKPQVAATASDGVVRLWHLDGGEPLELRGHAGETNFVNYSADGSILATSSDDGTVRLWDSETGASLWRAPLMLADPPLIATHNGWFTLDGGEPAEQASSTWQKAVQERARTASARGDTLCLVTNDEKLELWSRTQDQQLVAVDVPLIEQVRAVPEGCVTLARDQASLYTRTGALRGLAEGATAVAVDGEGIRLAAAGRVLTLDLQGEELQAIGGGTGATALLGIGDQLVLGFSDGNLELLDPHAAGEDADDPSFRFMDVPSSEVTGLLEGPMQTLLAGYANGTVGIWDLRNGVRLEHTRLHGPVSMMMLIDGQLHVATDLGDHQVVDLGALRMDYCELVRHVWDAVPVVWEDGLAVIRPPDAAHRCSP